MLSVFCSGCGAISDGVAVADVKLWSMGDYIYVDPFKTNLPYDRRC